MTQPIVSDAGPIITFARAGKLDLLKEVIGNLQIPQAVYDEVVVKGAGKPGAHEVKSADWIQQQTCEDLAESVDLPVNLGKGEKEAIVLSVQRGACLLVDDPVARREARNTEIPIISTLDVLDEAKDRGFIPEVKEVLESLVRSGFRLKMSLYEAKLQLAGEHV